MKTASTLQELKDAIGQQVRASKWVVIDQARIDAFADVTGDHQWIHTDPARAKDSPFGGTIAHGMLTASVANHLPVDEVFLKIAIPRLMGVNYGFNRIRFPAPVRSGSRIRTVVELLAVDMVSEGVLQLTQRSTVQIEGSPKPAMVAESLTRLYLA
jgi:acyl dehydratase